MARTRSENYDEIYDGIRSSATALFAKMGYMRTSISDLADACQLSRGALYHYFDSKEAILFSILDAHVRKMIADVEQAKSQHESTVDQFRAMIRAIVELNARSSEEQRLILNDLAFLAPEDQQKIKDLERRLVEAVSELLVKLDRDGKIVKRTRKVYTMMLFGMLNFSHTWYDPKGGIDPKEFADRVVDLYLNGVLPPAPVKKAP
jgi:AcrR family transcriptional regulator